ncbi:MAG: TIGR04086 family membrane protein [Eubacteriales bacterium]
MPRMKQKLNEMRIMVPALKSSIMAMIFTITAILVFALIVKSAEMDTEGIVIVNEIIKIVGIVVAALFAAKDPRARKVLSAGIAGLLYIAIGFVVFSIIQGSIGDIVVMLTDAAMGILIGFAVGLIASRMMKTKMENKMQGKKPAHGKIS